MTHYQFSQIFLGFAAKDRYTVAESLLYHLENYGVPVWYDRHDLILSIKLDTFFENHAAARNSS